MFRDAVTTGSVLSKNSRPQNVLYSGLLAVFCARSQGASKGALLGCYMLIMLLYALATTFNNIADIATDRINKRIDNPLTVGALGRTELVVFAVLATASVGVLQLWLAQPAALVVTVVYMALSYAYSDKTFRLKSRGFWGIVLLCACYGLLPVVLGLAQGRAAATGDIATVGLVTFVLIFPFLLAKDYKDLVGDKATGNRTPLVRLGARRLQVVANSVAVGAAAAYGAIALREHVNVWFVALLVVLYCALLYGYHRKQARVHRVYRFALLAVLLCMPVALL